MTKARLRKIKAFIRDCRAVADDNDPMPAMIAVMEELVKEVEKRT